MGHNHDHGGSTTGRRLLLSVFVTIAFVIGEVGAGYFSNSLALLSDAGHNFADALALILSWYGLWVAQKPSTAQRTFGYHRVGILTALVNAVTLVVIALLYGRVEDLAELAVVLTILASAAFAGYQSINR